mgnify:CR=1 FL=1
MSGDRGVPTKWRPHFNQLIARPIPRSEFPKIVERMFNDGLYCDLTYEGAIWYSGRYQVTAKVVRTMWGLSPAQWKRFMRWVYEEAPFRLFAERAEDGEDIQSECSTESDTPMGPE